MTAGAASAVDRKRLARLLGMLGSDYPGERDNAGRLADRLVREAGMTGAQFLGPPALPEPPTATELDTAIGDHRALIQLCIQQAGGLSGWKTGFIDSIRHQRAALGPVQSALLSHLPHKALAAAKAGRTAPAPPPHQASKPKKPRRSRHRRREAA